MDFARLADHAATELGAAVRRVEAADLAASAEAITAARRIVLHGTGREGLMMRALAMRLYHLGLDAHVLGEMSCPPIGPGDLLLPSSGPRQSPTALALVGMGHEAGARTACVTAQPAAPVPAACDIVLTIPAQTMADDCGPDTSVLPMGSLFEGAQFLMFELLVLDLRGRLAVTPEAMRANHTNVE